MIASLRLLFAALAAVSVLAVPSVLQAQVKKGEPLPKLNKLDYQGKKPDLEGKVVMVEFWATWCPPCRTSIPHLNALHKKYADQGLVIIGVTDEEEKTVKDFQKKNPMDYAVAFDKSGKLDKQFGVKSIPYAFIADRSGKIVWIGHPMGIKDDIIENALKSAEQDDKKKE